MKSMRRCTFDQRTLANQKSPWPLWKPPTIGATNVTYVIRFANTTAAEQAEGSISAGFEEQLINDITGFTEVLNALIDADGPEPVGVENKPALRATVISTHMFQINSTGYNLVEPATDETGDGPYPCSDSAS